MDHGCNGVYLAFVPEIYRCICSIRCRISVSDESMTSLGDNRAFKIFKKVNLTVTLDHLEVDSVQLLVQYSIAMKTVKFKSRTVSLENCKV